MLLLGINDTQYMYMLILFKIVQRMFFFFVSGIRDTQYLCSLIIIIMQYLYLLSIYDTLVISGTHGTTC